MDRPQDNNKSNVVSLDFYRRARAGYTEPSDTPAMAFTPYEMQQLTHAYEGARAAGVLQRFEVKQDDITSHFNMFRPATALPSVFVTRSKMGKFTQYKCWTTYKDYQTVAEDYNFETFMSAVRSAVNAMTSHYTPKGPKP